MFKYEIGIGLGLKHTKMAGASRIASEELFGRAAFTKFFWGIYLSSCPKCFLTVHAGIPAGLSLVLC